MKLTLNWLKRYVELDWTVEQIAERLTMLGLEVERVERVGGEFEGVVVAEVLTRDKHPNADKLSVCRVRDGQGERQIVCGAQNFQPGDKVPLILPGASLPERADEAPFTIKVGKIRGVESHGMMCSPKELGLADDAQGLMILPATAVVGQPFAVHLGRPQADVVYDLEVTPNRPDWNSVIGIARELAALAGRPLKLPELPAEPVAGEGTGASVGDWVTVRVEEPELCGRYTARVIAGVRIGPSPDWLRACLEGAGVRSINNVVDVTNFVMLETGQPLHAFDHRLLAGDASPGKPATIVVRRAAAGERFVTLDGQTRELGPGMLLIADERRGVALAGIMGGQNTEIRDDTRDVLIESAWFLPSNIRRTSKALGLRSESSYRFERGADIAMADWASRRAAALILETAGGRRVPGVVDACAASLEGREVALRHARVGALFGIDVPRERQAAHLRGLGLEQTGADADATRFRVPTFRVDLKQEVDLIEEVARLEGVDRIPASVPRGYWASGAADAAYDHVAEVRRVLGGLGLDEAQGQTLIASAAAEHFVARERVALLANPLSSDMDALRPSLLPGLLDAVRRNAHHKTDNVALYEVGRVFLQEGGRLREERRIAFVLTGARAVPSWRDGATGPGLFEAADARGLIEELFEAVGMRGVTFARNPSAVAAYLESCLVQLGGKLTLGEFGRVGLDLARWADARHPIYVAELSLDQILARRNPARSFKPLPQFPAIRRDVAFVVPEAVTHDAVMEGLRRQKIEILESVEVFDVFRGDNLPAGHKSLAYAFTYRHGAKTLAEGEVQPVHDRLVAELQARLGATLRG